MTKRGNNEGTIYRRPDGRWCAQVTLPRGKRLTKYARTRTEVREWLTAQLSKADQGLPLDVTRATVSQYLAHWLEIVRPTLRPNTHRQYQRITARHILPTLGSVRLAQLRPDHLHQLYSAKLEAGLGARTIQLIHAIIHRALRQAVEWDFIPRNPAETVKPPKSTRHEIHPLTAEQARHFLATARELESRYQAIYHLAITTGLRCSELLGLRWSDLEQSTGALQVQRQLYRETDRGFVYREPKTLSGRRVVMLSRQDLAVLRHHRQKQLTARLFAGPAWQEADLIFTTRRGSPVDQRRMTDDFKRILRKAGLPNIRFHDLRHTAASLMLQSGIHPKVVQERLGHADISLTLNTYSHITPALQSDAAETIAALLEK